MKAACVGTSVSQAVGHPVEQIKVDFPGLSNIDDSGYTAHITTILREPYVAEWTHGSPQTSNA